MFKSSSVPREKNATHFSNFDFLKKVIQVLDKKNEFLSFFFETSYFASNQQPDDSSLGLVFIDEPSSNWM